jgi:hypothetical protein
MIIKRVVQMIKKMTQIIKIVIACYLIIEILINVVVMVMKIYLHAIV